MNINEMLAGTIPEDVLDQILGQHPSERISDGGMVPHMPYLQRGESNYGANDLPASDYGAMPNAMYGNFESIYDTNPARGMSMENAHAETGGCC